MNNSKTIYFFILAFEPRSRCHLDLAQLLRFRSFVRTRRNHFRSRRRKTFEQKCGKCSTVRLSRIAQNQFHQKLQPREKFLRLHKHGNSFQICLQGEFTNKNYFSSLSIRYIFLVYLNT